MMMWVTSDYLQLLEKFVVDCTTTTTTTTTKTEVKSLDYVSVFVGNPSCS